MEAIEKNPPALDPERFAAARAIVEQRIVHVDDLASPNLYGADDKHRIRTTQLEGIRTVLFVPLIWEQQSIGAIGLWRREVKPFSEDEIALVETFAAQAVIAIENVRQFREVQERLERERASSEILQVISQSRDDDTPVFKTIVENAARLCNAPMTFLVLIKEDHSQWKVAAATGDATSMMQVGNVFDVGQEFAPYQSIKTRRIVEEPDVRETDFYKSRHPDAIKLVDEDGIRSRVFVPLVSGGKSLGNLVLLRREVGHFAPEDLLLVETFAAQAVIAIENVRQFRKVQTQLERERATSEILKVISESRDDETPVFDLMLRKAAQLCNADAAALALGTKGGTYQTMPASYGIAPATQEMYDSGQVPMDPETSVGAKAILSGKPVHVRDMSDTEQYRSGVSIFQSVVQDTGIRTNLLVPLLTPAGGIGVLILFRKEVRPYTEDEIALVETFAAQAVIAIENVGQFREVQERLEREAATSEVLSIISQSRDDERPVFDTILKKAAELCDANQASLQLANAERTHFGVAAYWGFEETAFQVGGSAPLHSGRPIPQVISTGCSMNIKDLSQSDHYRQKDPIITHVVDIEGIRSWLIVPLMKDKQAIGAIALSRREVKSFNDFEIALVETFAAQAVIAIENVRQFKALEELNAELGDRVEEQVDEIERMGRLKRFLPAAVADTVVSQGSDNLLKSHRALLGVLFCDIRGFTAFCETAEPKETIEVLQSYHEEMGALIAEHGAGVDTRAGDGIMVLFNDPLPCDDPAGDALRLGLAMRERMAELSKKWRRHGHRLGFGVGISLGYATVGMVGSAGRFDYTASGTAVNLAARLCDQAKDGEILLSPRAYTAVEDDFDAEPVGELTLKGIHAPVEVFRVRTEG
ncbi:MAG: GAF domain-containing protein [Tateyamaria sp.]|uniref:GAF domain-containing protein n=1 Tax=Tateyamaria sp. TaxID=1929288 RepID=UPI00326F1EE2